MGHLRIDQRSVDVPLPHLRRHTPLRITNIRAFARAENGIPRFESRYPDHAVQYRTSLHFLTPQNGHFLGNRERLFGQLGHSGSNLRISETDERTESPVFVGLLTPSLKRNGETALAGWGAWIRTRECRNQNPVPYHLATPQRGRARPV